MPDYSMILERLINTPLLAHPEKAEVVAAVVLRHRGVEINVEAHAEFIHAPKASPLQERRMVEQSGGAPYLFDPQTGIAVIPITGSLAHRKGFVGKSSGVMGYDGIGAQFQAALDSSAVRGIIFDIHSAGGEVAGVFQLADRIHAARGRKPMIAISDEMAYSAAYMLAAAADEIWLASNTAGVGSVGVVVVHFSFEEMLKTEGVKVTIIHAGARKADGNPFQDIPADALARIQGKVNFIYGEFVPRMAAWRGMTEKAVRDTEADTFLGPDAVKVGFADGVADPMEVFDAFADQLNSRPLLRAV